MDWIYNCPSLLSCHHYGKEKIHVCILAMLSWSNINEDIHNYITNLDERPGKEKDDVMVEIDKKEDEYYGSLMAA